MWMWNYGAKFFDAWRISKVTVVNDGKDLNLSMSLALQCGYGENTLHLVGGLEHVLFIPYIWNNHRN